MAVRMWGGQGGFQGRHVRDSLCEAEHVGGNFRSTSSRCIADREQAMSSDVHTCSVARTPNRYADQFLANSWGSGSDLLSFVLTHSPESHGLAFVFFR